MSADHPTEAFRLIEGFPGYRVSDRGRVQSCRRSTRGGKDPRSLRHYLRDEWYDLRPALTQDGYYQATIFCDSKPKRLMVHRLVAEAFIGPCPPGRNMVCRHLNDKPTDNRAENLAWGNGQDNFEDRVRLGKVRRAIEPPKPKAPVGVIRKADRRLLAQLKGQEVFREVPGFPGYRVSNLGKAQTCWEFGPLPSGRGSQSFCSDRWRDLRPARGRGGYLFCSLRQGPAGARVQRTVLLHRAVLDAFVGPRPAGMVCRHLNGVRTANRLDNLAWGYPWENGADKQAHGTAPKGLKNPAARLSEGTVQEIRDLHAGGLSCRKIARMFGLSATHVSRIVNRLVWSHI
jgi:HNH endonuclease/NUMOD4 motif-containing protein